MVGIYPEGPRRVDDGLGCRVAKERCRNAEMALQPRSPCMVCEEFFLEGGRRRRPSLSRRYIELEAEEEGREDWACEGQPDRAF